MLRWLHQRLINKNKLDSFLFITIFIHLFLIWLIFFGCRQSIDFSFTLNKSSSNAIVKLLPFGAVKPKNNLIKQGSYKNSTAKQSNKKKHRKESKKTAIIKEKKQKKINSKKNKKKDVDQKDIQISAKDEALDHKDLNVSLVKNNINQLSDEKPAQESKEDVVYVTQKELDGLQLEQQLKEAIEQVWVSPFGIENDLMCEVLVVIGWDGAILEKKMIKLTEVYIYDSAVEEALDKLIVPQQLWGKTISIIFKP